MSHSSELLLVGLVLTFFVTRLFVIGCASPRDYCHLNHHQHDLGCKSRDSQRRRALSCTRCCTSELSGGRGLGSTLSGKRQYFTPDGQQDSSWDMISSRRHQDDLPRTIPHTFRHRCGAYTWWCLAQDKFSHFFGVGGRTVVQLSPFRGSTADTFSCVHGSGGRLILVQVQDTHVAIQTVMSLCFSRHNAS